MNNEAIARRFYRLSALMEVRGDDPFRLRSYRNAAEAIEVWPTPLKEIAEYNPLSAVAGAMRELFGNPSPHVSDAWPLVHPVAATVLWSVAIVAVVAPLAVRRYRRLAAV